MSADDLHAGESDQQRNVGERGVRPEDVQVGDWLWLPGANGTRRVSRLPSVRQGGWDVGGDTYYGSDSIWRRFVRIEPPVLYRRAEVIEPRDLFEGEVLVEGSPPSGMVGEPISADHLGPGLGASDVR